MRPLLHASRLAKRFGARTVLAGIDLDVDRGQCIGVEGAPGSGRSTLLRLLATLLPPTSGTLEIDGVDPATGLDEVRRKVALVAAPFAAAPGLEAREWLRFVAAARGAGRLQESAIAASLARAGLSGRAPMAALPRRLQRRLGLEAAWLSGAGLVLIDDADGGAVDGEDPALAASISGAIAAGRAVIAVVNASGAAAAACTHLMRLDDGRLSADRAARPSQELAT